MNMAFFSMWFLLLGQFGFSPGGEQLAPERAAAVHGQVARHLQTGGDRYSIHYMGGQLEATIAQLRELIGQEDAEMGETFAAIDRFCQMAGLYGLEATGFSTVPTGDGGMKHLRCVMVRSPQSAEQPVWRALLGREGDERRLLHYLPENTVWALDVSPDVDALWTLFTQGFLSFAHKQDEEALQKMLAEMSENLGADLKVLLDSLGNELVLSVQLDDAAKSRLPLGGLQAEIPTPSFVILARASDDRIARHIVGKTSEAGITWNESEELGMAWRTFPAPLPLPVGMQPTMAYGKGVLMVASTPAAGRAAAEAANSAEEGLTDTKAFARIFGGSKVTANAVFYSDPAIAETLLDIASQASATEGGPDLAALLGGPPSMPGGWTIVNRKDAVLLEGIGTGMAFSKMSTGGTSQLAMFMGMAMPAMHSARRRAQAVGCQANLRMLEGAKQQWALENNVGEDHAPPTEADLAPYLKGGFDNVKCPKGGTYTIGDLQTPADCSYPGH
jgi:hypothetical protein